MKVRVLCAMIYSLLLLGSDVQNWNTVWVISNWFDVTYGNNINIKKVQTKVKIEIEIDLGKL